MNDTDNITNCANCGKGEESSGDLKACTACKLVKYCNRECQIAHRPLHKKACKKRAAELHEEALFKEHTPKECPICFLPMVDDANQNAFRSCCGKRICNGCTYAMEEEAGEEVELCPFCRTPAPTSDEEEIQRLNKLMKKDIADAYHAFAGACITGSLGLPRDRKKANELMLRAGELGCAESYYNLGICYMLGKGGEVDKKKGRHFFELAAMNGDVQARHNLAALEGQAGNITRAYKHFIIAAKSGDKQSLEPIKKGFMRGHVTKDEYANTLRAYQKIQDEMKSDTRDKINALEAARMG